MPTKFDYYSFRRSRDMIDAHKNLNGSRDLTTPLSWMISHPRLALTTINGQPIYQSWNLYLHPLQRYEKRYKISKIGWLGVVKGHWRSLGLPTGRFGCVHSFGCNSAENEPIWLKSGALWVRNARSRDSLRGRRTCVFLWGKYRTITPITRRTN